MANTTNIDLVKPAGTDHALVSVMNQNSDKIDAFAGKTNAGLASVQDGIAIVADGDTHAAIASGQFVYVKNHSTLSEGLYRATAAIATDAALSTSNLAADSSGGMNALKTDLDTLNSNLTALRTPMNTPVYCVVAGFNTGSGNYFDFFYPCYVDISKNYTVALTQHSILYANSRKNSGMSATAEVLHKYSNGLVLELSFTETQTASISGTFAGNITLNVAS